MRENAIQSIIDQALNDAAANNYAGFDPYDALNTSWRIFNRGKWMPVLLIQAMKRNPVNMRRMLGIKKGHNPKGIGLLLEASVLMEQSNPGKYRSTIDRLIRLLEETQTEGYNGTCWGYNFDWASPVKTLPAGSPTVVVTGFIAKGLYEAVQLGNNPAAERLFRGIEDFVAVDLPRFSDETGLCISYSTVKKDCCFNASLLAAGYLARLFHLTEREELREEAISLVNFVVARQKSNGVWAYSIDLDSGKERTQIDFHQGFILDSITEVMEFLGERPPHWLDAVKKGSEFYFKEQFSKGGRSYFRLPRKYPTDVHHQAQGIISATKLSNEFPEYAFRAETMVKWALKYLHDGNGRFHYRVFPAFTDKTHYLRWGQAWMVLALARWYRYQQSE